MGKKAFLIGKNTKGLQYAESDAELLGSVLKKYYGFEIKIINSKKEFNDSFEYFLDNELKTNDDFIVYFSGHAYSPTGELVLIVGEDVTKNSDTILSSQLFDRINSCRAKQTLIILDCCRANAVFNGWNPPGKTKYRLLAASSDTGTSSELDELNAGFLTFHLCKGLTKNVSEVAGDDGAINIDNLYRWIVGQTLSYNLTNNTDIAKPKLMGEVGVSIQFGNLNQLKTTLENQRKIFLSVPNTEKGLTQREAFLNQVLDKKEHDKWDFDFIPSSAEVKELEKLDFESFEKAILNHVDQSIMSVQLITSDKEFDDHKSLQQYKLIKRHAEFSISHKKFYWLLDTNISQLQNNYHTYKNVIVEFTSNSIEKIIEGINAFANVKMPGTVKGARPQIAFIYDHSSDHNNANRIRIKKKMQNCPDFSFRPCSIKDNPDKEHLTNVIKDSAAAIIFYGYSDSSWYTIYEDIVLWQIKDSRHFKLVYLDNPDPDIKLERDVNEPEFDKIIRGDIEDINCKSFKGL